MYRRASHLRLSAIVAALAVIAAAAPRAAFGAIVPLSQSHLLTAHARLGDAVADDSDTNSTIGPVNGAQARVALGSTAPQATLDFSPSGQIISGHLAGDVGGQPAGGNLVTEGRAEGNFTYTFTVTEATPFALSGRVTVQGRFLDNVGRAEVRLTEDGTRIGGGAIGPVPGVPGGASPVVGEGTLLPGRTYALTASLEAGVVVDPLGNLEFSNSDAEFTLTVPEPAAVGLLVPAALHVLSSRGRRRPGGSGASVSR